MTDFPAHKFQLIDREIIREGAYADLVVFDPDTTGDVSTYQEPRKYPPGIDCVIVNGKVTAKQGQHTGDRNGRLLKHKR